MDSHWLFREEVLDTHRERALHFLTDLSFPPEPGGEAAVAFTPFPALAVLSCIPAAGLAPEGGQSLPSPGTPALAKHTAPSQLGFSFVVESWGNGENPQCCLPHLAAAPGAAGSRRCLDSKGMFSTK